MAKYKGRTFSDSCSECGVVFYATTLIGAERQAQACYDKHFPPTTRDLKEALDEAWDAFGGRPDGS
jgi:hypothetical protein